MITATRLLAFGVALAAAMASFIALPPAEAALFALFGAAVMAVTVTDLEQFIIPDSASFGILALGVAFVLLTAEDRQAALIDTALRAAIAALALYLVRIAYRRLAGIPGLGLGDVKLAAAAGPWLGWSMLPVAVELAAIAALLVIGIEAWRSGTRPERHAALPFGAFLAPAIWLAAYAEHALGWSGLGLD